MPQSTGGWLPQNAQSLSENTILSENTTTSFAGTFSIRSQPSPNTYYVGIPEANNKLFALVVGRQSDVGRPQQWNLVPSGLPGSNLYTVHHGSNAISIEEGGLRVYLVAGAGGEPAAFSVESAGDKLVRFNVPNDNRVWTLAEPEDGSENLGNGVEIKLQPDQGLPTQRWSLVPSE